MGCPPLPDPAHEAIERALAAGLPDAARTALLDWLRGRAAGGDETASVTLRVLAQARFAPDALAAATDRLLALVDEQDAQIRALQALIEDRL